MSLLPWGEGGRRPDGPPCGRCPDNIEKTSILNRPLTLTLSPRERGQSSTTQPLPQGRGDNKTEPEKQNPILSRKPYETLALLTSLDPV